MVKLWDRGGPFIWTISKEETETNYYLSRCIALTRRNEFHYARIMLSGIIRNEFTLMGEEATNRMFTAKIRTILNTIYYHLGSFS